MNDIIRIDADPPSVIYGESNRWKIQSGVAETPF
jgi:hypothetical protein